MYSGILSFGGFRAGRATVVGTGAFTEAAKKNPVNDPVACRFLGTWWMHLRV